MNEMFNQCYIPPIKFGCHISKKMMAKNAKKDKNKTHRLVHGKHFLCIVISTCRRQDRFNKLLCTLEAKMDDKDDKLTKRQANNGRTQIKLH